MLTASVAVERCKAHANGAEVFRKITPAFFIGNSKTA